MGIYIVLAKDRPQAVADRLLHRQKHLDYWSDKSVKVAGAMLDGSTPSGSAFLIEAASEAAVRLLIAADPFTRHGIFAGNPHIVAMRPAIGDWLTAP